MRPGQGGGPEIGRLRGLTPWVHGLTLVVVTDITLWWADQDNTVLESEAKCLSLTIQEVDDLFFPGSGGKPHKAEKFCNTCPLKGLCLQNAIQNGATGFLAGTTQDERRMMKRINNDLIVQLRMPDEPDRTERRRYLHVVKSSDPREWMDSLEPTEAELEALVE